LPGLKECQPSREAMPLRVRPCRPLPGSPTSAAPGWRPRRPGRPRPRPCRASRPRSPGRSPRRRPPRGRGRGARAGRVPRRRGREVARPALEALGLPGQVGAHDDVAEGPRSSVAEGARRRAGGRRARARCLRRHSQPARAAGRLGVEPVEAGPRTRSGPARRGPARDVRAPCPPARSPANGARRHGPRGQSAPSRPARGPRPRGRRQSSRVEGQLGGLEARDEALGREAGGEGRGGHGLPQAIGAGAEVAQRGSSRSHSRARPSR
jgi:hypothetical protein